MKVFRCSACGNDHDEVTVITDRRIDGDTYFQCPENGKTVFVRQEDETK